jgi:probable addiction module antidote protein
MLEQLADSRIAANYLNAAILDSPTLFLTALRDVAKAHKMAKVARGAGVRREALYRTLSVSGNPRLNTLDAVLKFLGLRLSVEPETVPQAPIGILQLRAEMGIVEQAAPPQLGAGTFSTVRCLGTPPAQELDLVGYPGVLPAIHSQHIALGGR